MDRNGPVDHYKLLRIGGLVSPLSPDPPPLAGEGNPIPLLRGWLPLIGIPIPATSKPPERTPYQQPGRAVWWMRAQIWFYFE